MKEGKKKEFSSNIMTSKRMQHQTINLKTSKVSQGRRARTKLHGDHSDHDAGHSLPTEEQLQRKQATML